MGKIKDIRQDTHNRFLNYFTLNVLTRTGREKEYYLSSRAEDISHLKLRTGVNTPDGVSVYALYGEARDRVVMIRQFRYPIGGWVYEFPSGIIDPGETYREAAVREFREETGLQLDPLVVDPIFEAPRFQTIGMTDESCALVFGYASGEPTSAFEEDSEEIEVVLADRAMVRDIMQDAYVSANCAHHLMHFLADEDPFSFLV